MFDLDGLKLVESKFDLSLMKIFNVKSFVFLDLCP